MAFEIYNEHVAARRPRNTKRLSECKRLFELLAADPDLTAKVDMNQTQTMTYARKLGYIVRTRKEDSFTCFVWVIKKIDRPENNNI